MKAYHYTSKRNWAAIQKEGLKPVHIYNETLKESFEQNGIKIKDNKAVMFFMRDLDQEEEKGFVIAQAHRHGDAEVVKLELNISEDEMIKAPAPFQRLFITHNHTTESKRFIMKSEVPMQLTERRIRPKRIKLQRVFTVMPGNDVV